MDDDETRAGPSAGEAGRTGAEADTPGPGATPHATVWVVEPDDSSAGRDADSSGRNGGGIGREDSDEVGREDSDGGGRGPAADRPAADCEHAPGDLRHVGDDGVNSYYQCTRCGSVLVAQDEVVRAARRSGESRDPRGRTG